MPRKKASKLSPQLKIGFVLDDGLDRPDGVQQFVLTVGEWLAYQGHEVRYLAGETNRRDIAGTYPLAKNLSVRFSGNKLTSPLPTPKKKIRQVLQYENFDVLHIQVPYSPFFAGRVVKAADAQTAVIGTFHILPYSKLGDIGTRALGLYLSSNLKRFDKFFSVSSPAREFAQKSFRINSEVMPNPVNINKFKSQNIRSKNKKGSIRMLFLGRLVPRKGCLQLLKALKLLNDDREFNYNFSLDICGHGPERAMLQDFVQENGLEGKVKFCGFVSEEEKIEYLRRTDIAIFPSYSGESFGFVLIEAMAAGSGVVLGGNNPGYSSVLKSVPASIIDVKEPDIFAKQISPFIKNKNLCEELHKKQQSLIKQFDINVIGPRLLEAYYNCINYRSR